jgi:hypothetical protein
LRLKRNWDEEERDGTVSWEEESHWMQLRMEWQRMVENQ